MSLRAFSFGGGVQSTAALVLAAEGRIDFPLFIFAQVGAESENTGTLDYLRDIAHPYAAAHDIELAEVARVRRDGTTETLMQRIDRATSGVPIPMRLSRTGMPSNRSCTVDFKINVVAKELKRRGATKANPAVVGLGISMDEFHRMRSDSGIAHETLTYPLIDLGLTRQDCLNVITRAGLPVPPRSSCFYCPFHTRQAWRDLLRNEPEQFAKAVTLERQMNARRAALGKDPVWMTGGLRPLDEVITENGQLPMFGADASCDAAGYCHV